MAFTDKTVRLAWKRAGNGGGLAHCQSCQKQVKWANRGRARTDGWEADHMVPRFMGGPDQVWNCRILCWECHRKVTGQQAAVRAVVRRSVQARPSRAVVRMRKPKVPTLPRFVVDPVKLRKLRKLR